MGRWGSSRRASRAPDVAAVDATGATTTLSSLRGQAVVVYFYPADGTPGCTKEAAPSATPGRS